MTTIQTKPRTLVADKLRAVYLKWRLDHVERDIHTHEMNAKIARSEAEQLRVELARMGQL